MPSNAAPGAQKISLYEKLVGRKSLRAQRHFMKQNSRTDQRINGSIAKPKPRPRIPTPDVSKDTVNEKQVNVTKVQEKVQNTSAPAQPSPVATGVAMVSQQLANNPSVYPGLLTSASGMHVSNSDASQPLQYKAAAPSSTFSGNDVPMVGLLLSPIKEMESLSVNSTLQANHPATKALAKAVLPATLKSAGINSSGTTLATLTLSNSEANSNQQPVTLMLPVTTSELLSSGETSNVFVISTAPSNSMVAPSLPTSPIPTDKGVVESLEDGRMALSQLPTTFAEETPPTPVTTTELSFTDHNVKTIVTTFPIKKSSSFSDVSQYEGVAHRIGVGNVCDAPDGGYPTSLEGINDRDNEEKVSIEIADLPSHSRSEPASKTSTLTKREVYV